MVISTGSDYRYCNSESMCVLQSTSYQPSLIDKAGDPHRLSTVRVTALGSSSWGNNPVPRRHERISLLSTVPRELSRISEYSLRHKRTVQCKRTEQGTKPTRLTKDGG